MYCKSPSLRTTLTYTAMRALIGLVLILFLSAGFISSCYAHGVSDGDALFIQQASGLQLFPFAYLGAKHMLTGYDHLLFLTGVIFFLYKMKEVCIYVTLFAISHSATLLYGVLSEVQVNAYIIDAIIGFSVVYKALDNLGAFRRWFGFQLNTKAAVTVFGLFHGFGLATKLQDFTLPEEGLVANILAFNVGVELGQLMALAAILILMNVWRKTDAFARQAYSANILLMSAGFVLIGYQLTGYFTLS